MENLISIIIPVYNAEKQLSRCIRSARNQTYENLEIILVNDGSTDQSFAICSREAKEDPRILVIDRSNGGVASARNTGFARAKGQWLMTMDADDYMEKDFVELMLLEAKEQQADLVIGSLIFTYEDGTLAKTVSPSAFWAGDRKAFAKDYLVELYKKQLIHNMNNKLYRRSLWSGHPDGTWTGNSEGQTKNLSKRDPKCLWIPEDMSINEDVLFSVRLLTRAGRIALMPDSGYHYWQHIGTGGSLVSRFYKNGVDTCFTLLEAVEKFLMVSEAPERVQNFMRNEMIFHICGFAGLTYYRSGYSPAKCYREIVRLSERRDFRELLKHTRIQGVKNQVAAFLLGHRLCGAYDRLCRILYRGKN